MNVLLSRAKWKLVLVGSLRFIEVVRGSMAGEDIEKYRFLSKLVEAVDSGKRAREIAICSPSNLAGRA
jgi:hypothetical protein